MDLLWDFFHKFAPDGYTEFLHIALERGLRDGSLSAIGILHRRRAVEDLPGVEKAKASASANTLTIKGKGLKS